MIQKINIPLLCVLWLMCEQSIAQKRNMDALRQQIEQRLSRVEGNFAVALKDLKSGKTLFLNEKTVFHAASTMKTPVMMEVFKQVKAKKIRLTDSMPVVNEFKSVVDGSTYSLNIGDDSADGMYEKIGKKMTVYDLVFQMITVSSNLATNLLLDRVGAENTTALCRKIGANDIQIVRCLEDSKAFDKGINNTVTAFDLMLIFEKIAGGKAVSKKASHEMIEILAAQKFNEMIPAGLPAGTKVAHKTGNITGVQHDSGIIFLPDGRQYVLVLLSKNLKNVPEGVQAFADISGMIYKYLL
jgi:beta-lactamase class A